MRSRSTAVAAALALPGIVLLLLIATPVAAFAGLEAAGAVYGWWTAGPNYTVTPTATCLREHGYTVSRLDGYGYPAIRASRGKDWLDAYFTPSTDAADHLRTELYSAIERRNVVFDSMVELPRDRPVVACLRAD